MTNEEHNQFKSFALEHSREAEDAANAIICYLAGWKLTYVQAVETLNCAKEMLGEKAVLLPDSDTNLQNIADYVIGEIADAMSSAISDPNQL